MPFGDSKLDFASPQSDVVQYDNGKIQLVAANMLAVAAKVKRSRTPGGQKRFVLVQFCTSKYYNCTGFKSQ